MSNRGEGSSGWTANQDPQPHKPWISWLIPTIAIVNIVFFAYSMYANDCPARHPPGDVCILFPYLGRYSFEPLYINPLLGPAPGTLDTLGALDYKKIVSGEPWRLISCIWLHGGVIHLLVNMLSLLFIGIRQEQEFGFWKVGTLYIISGIGGSLMSSLSIHSKISVGASGALFGLLGAMLSELMINWALYANKCAALLTLLVVIALNMVVGMVPHVDSSAHIGGFISGFFLGFILLIRPQFGWVNQNCFPPGYDMNHIKPKHKVYQYVLWILAFVMLVIWSIYIPHARSVIPLWTGRAYLLCYFEHISCILWRGFFIAGLQSMSVTFFLPQLIRFMNKLIQLFGLHLHIHKS